VNLGGWDEGGVLVYDWGLPYAAEFDVGAVGWWWVVVVVVARCRSAQSLSSREEGSGEVASEYRTSMRKRRGEGKESRMTEERSGLCGKWLVIESGGYAVVLLVVWDDEKYGIKVGGKKERESGKQKGKRRQVRQGNFPADRSILLPSWLRH
jgi:hypothetical protein